MAAAKNKNVDLTTGVGTISFPHLFRETAVKQDDGTVKYDLQFIIPKSERETVRAILKAIKEVGEAKFGANWKKVRTPLRDGDAEADEPTEDGSTKGEKYPERLGCYFLNARSNRPVGVYDRQRNVILDPDEVYSGCTAKVALSFYAYSVSGNHGVAAGLNGVQKIADGEPLGGGGKPAVASMFDLIDDEDDYDLDDVDEAEEVEEAPKAKAKKKAPAKKAKVIDEDDLDDDDDLDLDDDL